MGWLSRSFQSPLKRAPTITNDTPTPSPKPSNQRVTAASQPTKSTTRSTPSKAKKHAGKFTSKLSASPLAALSIDLSDDSDIEFVGPPKPTSTQSAHKRKRNDSLIKREPIVVDLVEDSDSDVDVKIPIKPPKKIKTGKQSKAGPSKPAKRQKRSADENDSDQSEDRIKITRQLTCKKLITLTAIPSCWSVPQPGEDIAYLLDLTADDREWNDTSGNLLSMAAIIKSQVRSIVLNMVVLYIT